MRNEVDEPGFPDGVAIIGSDDGAQSLMMSYFDQRGVSRMYRVAIADGMISWWRDDPKIAQRVTITAQPDGSLVSVGRISENGGPWGNDLSQVFQLH